MSLTKMSADVEIHQAQPANFSQDYKITQAMFDEAVVLIKTYLNDQLTTQIDTEFATKAELASAVLGGLPADSVTNAYLGTDVKVGSLATLDTTDKDSVTDAINEVNTNADLANSTLADLELKLIMGGF